MPENRVASRKSELQSRNSSYNPENQAAVLKSELQGGKPSRKPENRALILKIEHQSEKPRNRQENLIIFFQKSLPFCLVQWIAWQKQRNFAALLDSLILPQSVVKRVIEKIGG